MDALKGFFVVLQATSLPLPAVEVAMLLALLSCCLVFKTNKTGLMTAYIFAYRWGWMFCTEHKDEYLLAYLIFGLVVGLLAVIGLLKTERSA